MGTPDYAVASLNALERAGYRVRAVFTQPDKPKGRGGRVQAPPAKEWAQQRGIEVYQPRRIRVDGVAPLRALAPDLCVTAAFGQILSEEVLAIPRLGTVNVHASLLPEYRGSAPVNWALIKGETRTGVTTMITDKGIDTGDILLQRATEIHNDETAGQLTDRLALLGADLLVETVGKLLDGTCPRTPQDESRMSYYPMLKKDMGLIDWQQSARDIAHLVRGLNPWPCAFTPSPHGVLKVLAARAADESGEPGTVLSADNKDGLVVACGEGALRIHTLQAAGGKAMAAADYLRGHPIQLGTSLQEGETP